MFGADPSLTALADAVGAYRQATGASAIPDDDCHAANNDFLSSNNESYDNGVGSGASIGAASAHRASTGATAMPDDSFLAALENEIGGGGDNGNIKALAAAVAAYRQAGGASGFLAALENEIGGGGDNGNIKALAAAVAAYRQAGGASAIPDDSFLGAMNEIGDKSGNSRALAAAAAAYRRATGAGKPTGESGVGISSYLDSISSGTSSSGLTPQSGPTDKSTAVAAAAAYRVATGASAIPDDDCHAANNDFLFSNNESYDNGVGSGASIGAASAHRASTGATAMPDDSFLAALENEIGGGGDNGNIKALAAAVAAYRQAGGASAIPDDSFLGAMNEIGDKSGNSGALAAAAAAYRGATGVGKSTGGGGVGISSYLDSMSSSTASSGPTSASGPTDKSTAVAAAAAYRVATGASAIPDDDCHAANNDFLFSNNESYDNGVGSGASIGAASAL